MKIKPCKICNQKGSLMYRVKLDETKNWYFACKPCTENEIKNNKHYRYGGTWKG